jgi:hypothetical protein
MANVALRSYLKRLSVEVAEQTFKFGRAQVFPFFAALATLVLQVVYRTSMSTNFRGNALATAWPYIIALGAYVLAQIIRAPLALDGQRADEIEKLKKQLGDGVSVIFEQITFRQPLPSTQNATMVVHLLLKTGDSPATVHDWELRSQAKPALKPVVANILGLGKHVAGWTIRLDAHDQAHGSIFFLIFRGQRNNLRNSSGMLTIAGYWDLPTRIALILCHFQTRYLRPLLLDVVQNALLSTVSQPLKESFAIPIFQIWQVLRTY